MKKANELNNVYDWLNEIYSLSQSKIDSKEAKFGSLTTKYGLNRLYLTVAREQFFDKELLKNSGGGVYLWNSIKPNIKMANKLIEETNLKYISYQEKYKNKNHDIKNHRKKWSSYDIKKLKSLLNQGFTCLEISKYMGRSYDSIKSQIRDNNLTNQHAKTINTQIIEHCEPIKKEVKIIEPTVSKDKKITFSINVTKIKHYFFRFVEMLGVICVYEIVKFLTNKL